MTTTVLLIAVLTVVSLNSVLMLALYLLIVRVAGISHRSLDKLLLESNPNDVLNLEKLRVNQELRHARRMG